MTEIEIYSDFIKLDAFLKYCGAVGTGGEAKLRIADGAVCYDALASGFGTAGGGYCLLCKADAALTWAEIIAVQIAGAVVWLVTHACEQRHLAVFGNLIL